MIIGYGVANEELSRIESQIKELIEKRTKLKEEINRAKRNNDSYSNRHVRISKGFETMMDEINEKREEVGFDILSRPKITELIIRHNLFPKIFDDLVHFNLNLETNGGICNER